MVGGDGDCPLPQLMKASRITLFLVPVALVALFAATCLWSSADDPPDQVLVVERTERLKPLEGSAMSAEPLSPVEMPRMAEAPVAVAEPKTPVQPLEERGDAMLFEINALVGTPFDESILRPFD